MIRTFIDCPNRYENILYGGTVVWEGCDDNIWSCMYGCDFMIKNGMCPRGFQK